MGKRGSGESWYGEITRDDLNLGHPQNIGKCALLTRQPLNDFCYALTKITTP